MLGQKEVQLSFQETLLYHPSKIALAAEKCGSGVSFLFHSSCVCVISPVPPNHFETNHSGEISITVEF